MKQKDRFLNFLKKPDILYKVFWIYAVRQRENYGLNHSTAGLMSFWLNTCI